MILVTGGTGLVGAHLLLHLLENGETVRAIYRTEANCNKTKNLFSLYKKEYLFSAIEWVHADILDLPSLEVAFREVIFVYHCAAIVSFSPDDEKIIRKTNIEGTANIVNLCLANNIQKLCHVSSIAALGTGAPHETLITETTEWNPEQSHSDYGISKYGAEMEVWRGQQEGLKVVIVNPGIILGPGFYSQGSGILFGIVKKGLRCYTLGTTGFVAIPDVVSTMYRLMKSNNCNERYVLVANNLNFKEVLFTIADGLKMKRPRWYVSPLFSPFIWRIDALLVFLGIKKYTFSRFIANALHTKTYYSNEKITTELKMTFIDSKKYIQSIAPYC